MGLEWLVGRVSRTLAWALQLAYVAVLTAAIVLQLLPADAWVPSIALGLAAGAAAGALYARATATRSVLVVLAPTPLVFAAAFLLLSDVSPLVLGDS